MWSTFKKADAGIILLSSLAGLVHVTAGAQEVDRIVFGRSGAWEVWGSVKEPPFCAAAKGDPSNRFGVKLTSTQTTMGVVSTGWKLDSSGAGIPVVFTVDGKPVMDARAEVISPRAISASIPHQQFAWRTFLTARSWMTVDFGKGLIVLDPQNPAPIEAFLRKCIAQLMPNASVPLLNMGTTPEVKPPAATSSYQDAMEAYHKGSYTIALQILRPLADQGLAAAQFNLGFMLAHGQGVPQDYAQALRWYQSAALQGSAQAQNNLGVMYEKGQGVPQNYAEAVLWFRLAADQGLAIAQNYLGFTYASGRGVPQDIVRAHMWFTLAAEQDYQPAVKSRDDLAQRMTTAQIVEAQNLARQWKLMKKPDLSH